MIYPLFSEVMLTEDIPEYGLTRYQTGVVVEHYSGLNGREDGYSIEGLIPGDTVEVTESQIQKVVKIMRARHFTHVQSEQNNKSLNGQKIDRRNSTKTSNMIFYDGRNENENLDI